ncbi:MAG: hypothetical protein HYV14_10290 [Elusimicrobia bacterium]|nr:hypothetical protein [Elusimicrobiota bacterium]
MAPRLISFVLIAALIGFAAPASAKPKEKTKTAKKQVARTWQAVADYVFKNGTDWPIKAPSSRTLGYESDEVPAKGLSIDDDKSKDGKEHSICVVYEVDEKGVPRPKGIDIGTMLVKETASGSEIDGYQIRMSLDGTPISAMHATGIVGKVRQVALPPEAKEIKALFAAESALYLKDADLKQLLP